MRGTLPGPVGHPSRRTHNPALRFPFPYNLVTGKKLLDEWDTHTAKLKQFGPDEEIQIHQNLLDEYLNK
jgi:hypothetical protein